MDAVGQSKPRYLTVGYGDRSAAFLRLQGLWLEQAGFAIGAGVRVQVTPGRLVIELFDKEAARMGQWSADTAAHLSARDAMLALADRALPYGAPSGAGVSLSPPGI